MDTSRFTEEQLAKARACGSVEELMLLASDEGVEITDEDLDQVSGGWADTGPKTKYVCKCGGAVEYCGPQKRYVCKSCGKSGMYPCDMNTVPL